MNDLIPVEKSRADFFVTGNEYIRDSLDLKFIPRANLCENDNRGVILAADNQTLQQSFNVAKDFFTHSESGTIKFVLIGLSPYNFSANDKKPPTACPIDEKVLDNYFKLCVDNGAKPVGVVLPVNSAIKKTYNAAVLKTFRDTINKVVKKYNATFIDLLDVEVDDEFFQNRSRLNSEGSAAVSVLLGVQLYSANIVSSNNLLEMDKDFFDVMSKYFLNHYKNIAYQILSQTTCDDLKRLFKTSMKENCMNLMVQIFSELTYNHLANLFDMLPKEEYNDLAARIFGISAEQIRRKNKIKVGFITYDSSIWCGDDLYNFFAADAKFEPTVFLCLRLDKLNDELLKEDFRRGVEQFKQHGLNVVTLDKKNATVPAQDVLIFLTPYLNVLPSAFHLGNVLTKTLTVYIPYTFDMTRFNAAHYPIVLTAWKVFLSSVIGLNLYRKKSDKGMPRSFFSGYSRMDIFFKPDSDFHFDWKMARPNVKKIIWAPHWSINCVVKCATFQWNYKFMYEIAKAHPETSWVVKPHPNLLFSAVREKVFPTTEAFKEYLQAWDDLPNAQVYTGAYYQSIFATSDGMIHDSGSFIAEYQYVDKPMIYLTNKAQQFNELGEEILKASYTVDGQDFDAIAAMIQRVFIEGDDYKTAERKAVFDKYLNYPKANGMLASEFIYKNIADELKAPTT